MLKLENINKSYNNKTILKDFSIYFREKEFVAILGPSGCGKSTLLNIIAALEIPDTGRIFLGEHKINAFTNQELDLYRSNYISYIFQSYNLINHLNIKDNINLNNKLKNKRCKKGAIINILNALGLHNIEKKYPNKLSGGEKQRIAIVKSLISQNPIILADEPTGALDSLNSDGFMKILKEVSKKKLVIMVTHNENLAKKYANRIIYLKDGQIKNDTNPYYKQVLVKLKKTKNKLKYLTAFKLSFNNLKNKKIRTYLTTLAFSIGLISLASVLSISNGFRNEINNLEQESLYSYPLIISKEAILLENIFPLPNREVQEGKINVNSQNIVRNEINDELLNKIKEMEPNLVYGISIYREASFEFRSLSMINPNNKLFNLLSGRFPENVFEVLILLDQNQAINETLANYLEIGEIAFEEIINHYIYMEGFILRVVGIVQGKTAYFSDLNGILYSSDLFNSEITDIHFFPSSYENKRLIKKRFRDFNIIDEAKMVIDLTNSLVNGISLILVVFSAISLTVSVIMIAIISYISVLERQKEIGLLKTMGVSKSDIKKLFLAENMIIGFSSGAFSLYLVHIIANMLNKYISSQMNINQLIDLNFNIIITIIILSTLLTYLAGLIPARIASKKRIVEILYSE